MFTLAQNLHCLVITITISPLPPKCVCAMLIEWLWLCTYISTQSSSQCVDVIIFFFEILLFLPCVLMPIVSAVSVFVFVLLLSLSLSNISLHPKCVDASQKMESWCKPSRRQCTARLCHRSVSYLHHHHLHYNRHHPHYGIHPKYLRNEYL